MINILILLGFSKVSARWIPHSLTEEEKKKRFYYSKNMLRRFKREKDKFLGNLITGDESWIPFFIHETKEKSKEWIKKGERVLLKVRPNRFSKKLMLSVFWDKEGLLFLELTSKTITADTYIQTLENLQKEIKVLRPNMKKIILLHDNAKSHTERKVKEKIMEFKWGLLDHPPYSPDLSPSDYYLFRPLKNELRGIRYPNKEELEFSIRAWFHKQQPDFFQKGIYKLLERWKFCKEVEGDYLEKKK